MTQTFWATDSAPPASPAVCEIPSIPEVVSKSQDAEPVCSLKELQEAIAAQETAYVRGLRDGEVEGRMALEQCGVLNVKLAATIRELAGFKAELRKQAVHELVQLAFGIARRILHREIHTDPEALRGIVSAALERTNRQELVGVRAHPDHVRTLRHTFEAFEPGSAIEILADPALAHGSVLFEMKGGILDASVDSQLEEIEHGLADRLRR